MKDGNTPTRAGRLAWLRKPSAKYSLLTLLSIGFVAGILFWGGFNTGAWASSASSTTSPASMR
ncbi:MAG TPA: hypothetical protein VNT33_09380 [Telluria sp.]|nr:hypothetical protein [Telluria sp.]